MTIREHIEAVVATMKSKPTFIYGSTDDLNRLVDTVTKFPVVFLLDIAPSTLTLDPSGAIAENNAKYMEFFSPCEFADDPNKIDLIQSEMLTEIKDFIIKAREYRVGGSKVFKFEKGDSVRSLNFLDKYDINVAGRTLDVNFKPFYPDSFC